MRCWLEINRAGGIIEKRKLTPDGGRALAEGACPGCKAEPFYVAGSDPQHMPDDRTLRSNGRSLCCGDAVGYLYARPDTVFGLEEDRNVLHGRCRVY